MNQAISHHFDPEPWLSTARLLETPAALDQYLFDVRNDPVIAVDTESASFYRYHARLNLVQLATPTAAAILDPQVVQDFTALRRFAEDKFRVWIFHGGDYDAAVLKTEMDVSVHRLFDTRIAANLLGSAELGLSSLADRYLGFPLDKKYQRCDWSRRPLTSSMKKYALLDAICLLPIRDHLVARLRESGRLAWVEEECAALAAACRVAELPPPNPHAFLIKGASGLSSPARAVLRELWLVREEIAGTVNRAPFMVVGNPGLLEMARQAPRTRAGLGVLKHVHRDFLQRYGARILEAIKRGVEAEPVPMPKPVRSPDFRPMSGWEGELMKNIREVRNSVANRIGIPASLLATPTQMCELARSRPTTPEEMVSIAGMKCWQAQELCQPLQELFQSTGPARGKTPRRRSRRRPRREQ